MILPTAIVVLSARHLSKEVRLAEDFYLALPFTRDRAVCLNYSNSCHLDAVLQSPYLNSGCEECCHASPYIGPSRRPALGPKRQTVYFLQ